MWLSPTMRVRVTGSILAWKANGGTVVVAGDVSCEHILKWGWEDFPPFMHVTVSGC